MSLYLSRLTLNPRDRRVQRELADCQALHRRVMTGFPGDAERGPRERYGVLYRVDSQLRAGRITLLVQSEMAPDWSALPQGYLTRPPEVKPIEDAYAQLTTGADVVFRLRANPTRRIHQDAVGTDGKPDAKACKRVELRTEEEQLGWLRRKGEEGGFALLRVVARPDQDAARFQAAYGDVPVREEDVPAVQASANAKVHGRRPGNRDMRLTFGSVLFEGRLRVTDVERFRETIRRGVGPAKAYGFGLLSVAVAPEHREEGRR